MAYNNQYQRKRSTNNGGGNNSPYNITTKADVQFYNSNMEQEFDCSTLTFSYWKTNLLLTINPMFTSEEKRGLENGDNRIYNYDVNMSIALDARTCYRLFKAIQLLELHAKKGNSAIHNVAIQTANKVVKVSTGSDLGVDNWYIGIYPKDSAEGLVYFFSKNNQSDEIIFNYNEEACKGAKTTYLNTELEILKDILKESVLMFSKGYSHEIRQELSKLKSHLDTKLQGGMSTPTPRSGNTVVNHRKRRTVATPVVEESMEFDPNELNTDIDVDLSDIENAFQSNEVEEPQVVKEQTLNDISELSDDFLLEGIDDIDDILE